MLDERSLRRPGFSAGPEVTLGDGGRWSLPIPTLRLFPIRGEDGRIAVGGGPSFGAEFEALMDELSDCDLEDTPARLTIQFRMAALLLLRNYDLSDRDLRDLLIIDAEDQECRERWQAINRAMTGRVPKPSADGSAAP
ncbi:MAG: hypothetical protein BGO49_17440 [Planctomycetales bacterium 71-10]|nr:MAG: hypothetical protein BGO49_17440 [Planctomycetales bacterium 71-10]